ncbi:MAG: N-acetylmuramoyl-L-alanine amidase [Selenomonadaceae bacterium]|nr:N-acetylmuramoyl-L-alanine amidase [Selenomonadaceae bacterium]
MVLREIDFDWAKRLERRRRTDAVVIHHVGNTDKNINAAAIHRWHRKNGWAGIGYHYIIRKDGSIERGRPLDAVGAHTYDHNDNTVGICVVGNFELSRPTSEQFRAAEKLVGAICRNYDITPNDKTVFGHKDFCKTTCPGIYLYKWLPDIIRNAI